MTAAAAGELSKEKEQAQLEEEMRKRRERIELWRKEKKQKELEDKIKNPVAAAQVSIYLVKSNEPFVRTSFGIHITGLFGRKS